MGVTKDSLSHAPDFQLIVIYKGKQAWDESEHCVINQDTSGRKDFLCFVRVTPFIPFSEPGSINEAAGCQDHRKGSLYHVRRILHC